MTEKKYSLNDEDYIYNDVGEVIDAICSDDEELIGHVYYEIDCRPMEASDIINTTAILESFDNALYEEIGDTADSVFYSLPKEAHNELQVFLTSFIYKHACLKGYWKCIGKARELEITEDDV